MSEERCSHSSEPCRAYNQGMLTGAGIVLVVELLALLARAL